MTPEQNKVASDVCYFLREGEKDIEAIAEVAGCSTGTVYKYRRMLYPELVRKYSKNRRARKLTKKQIEANFNAVEKDIAVKIKALGTALDQDKREAPLIQELLQSLKPQVSEDGSIEGTSGRKYKELTLEDMLASVTDSETLKALEEHKGHFGVDMVNSPKHYTAGGIETYDFIAAKGLSYELGNVVKYITRADHKGNRLQDLKKAQWYLNAAISREEKSNG